MGFYSDESCVSDMKSRQLICLLLLSILHPGAGHDFQCRPNQWQCDDGSCIADKWRCDGDGDCLDGSDEMDCTVPPGSSNCPLGQFPCVGSVDCVDASARCDGRKQCSTGSDEENCDVALGCLDSDWTCRNRICIPIELRCDGKNDCMDNSDEEGCVVCREGALQCADVCLAADQMCDGTFHCLDGSDEPITCGETCSVKNGGCSHVCVEESWGALCTCPPGYKLDVNGAVCKDVDECALPFTPCLHHCTNTVGSYFCHCREGFSQDESFGCLATGNVTRLLTVLRTSVGLLNVKSQRFEVLQILKFDPVALTYDIARGHYYWADDMGVIYKSDGQRTWTIHAGEPGIKGLACDWLNGNIFWTNQRTESIYVQADDEKSSTILLSKSISPSELVVLPVESLMFWINTGPGTRVTIERSWMDGSDRNSLIVLTAQMAHGLTADMAARRLYWISDAKMSIETMKVDGTGRYTFTGLFNKRPAVNLAVFESSFYWADDKGVWQVPQSQPKWKKFLWKSTLPLLTVFHELQQPRGSSACAKTPCQICVLTKSNPVGFTCTCPTSKVLMVDGTCDYPRFLYATSKSINLLEFKGSQSSETKIFATDEGILSFDVNWTSDWLYWADQTGHLQRTSLTQVKTELIPTKVPVCLIKVDQKSGSVYWVSFDQSRIGSVEVDSSYQRELYHTTREIRSLFLDWLRGGVIWLEEEFIFTMSMTGGKARELLHLDGVVENLAFDLRAASLLWNSDTAGLMILSLHQGNKHKAGKRWNVSGSPLGALEPYLLSLSSDVMTLWDRREGRRIHDVTTRGPVVSVVEALRDVHAVPVTAVCSSVLCKGTAICLPPNKLCDGKKDCPDGDDESLCLQKCPSKDDFKCKDRRSCVSRALVCDGRSHCFDGSDEVGCPAVAAVGARVDAVRCRKGSRPCKNGVECVLYNHLCDGENDCKDGSDEEDCEEQDVTSPNPNEITKAPPALPACVSPSVLCPHPSVRLCISPKQFCDGREDCPDGFDENNCVKRCSSKNDFRCKDRRSCISRSLVCDGRAHCHDGSDEVGCPSVRIPASQAKAVKCLIGSQLCRDGLQCVPFGHVCDGEPDCRDGSDEEGCDTLTTPPANDHRNRSPLPAKTQPPIKPSCTSPSFLCPDSTCIPPTQICDGIKHCPDGSDEKTCLKRCKDKSHFLCKDRRSCVLKKLVCDGRAHCHDGSDEVDCRPVAPPSPPANRDLVLKCRLGSRPCRDKTQCVPYNHVCDGEKDCADGSDEAECDAAMTTPRENGRRNQPPLPARTQPPIKPSCTSPSFLCPDSTCIPPTQICDGVKDCPDGSDEKTCLKRCKNKSDFLCKDRRSCVLRKLVCDGRAHCHDSSDEVDCLPVAPPPPPANRDSVLKCRLGSQLCQDGTQCVPYSHVCDGEKDCHDGSDEAECDPWMTTTPPENGRQNRPPLPARTQPPSKQSCTSPSFLCSDSTCIPPSQICDGVKDCPDGSDEKTCLKRCKNKSDFLCKDRRSCVLKKLVCDGRAHCHDSSDEVDCLPVAPPPPPANQDLVLKCRLGSRPCQDKTQCVPYSHVCDGEKDCQDGSDEEECDTRMTTPPGNGWRNRPPLPARTQPPIKPSCTSPSFLCPDSTCIPPTQICDGVKDCPDGSDEKTCLKRCKNKSDFLCKDRRSCVLKKLVCDGRAHCHDSSDEVDCSPVAPPPPPANRNSVLKCRLGSQLCQDGTQCVPYSHVCDGEKDCQDGSDEAECDTRMTTTSPENGRQNRPPLPARTQPPIKPSCTSPSFLCPDSTCIPPTHICDGVKDCSDGSDEKTCLKRCKNKSDFLCKDRRSCVLKKLVCDGRAHCHDSSDEVDCSPVAPPPPPANRNSVLKCRLGSQLCQDGTQCVPYSHVCDGEKDCHDGSDEEECDTRMTTTLPENGRQNRPPLPASTQPPSKPFCTSPSFLCPDSTCIPPTHICDGVKDCSDGSDEKTCLKRCKNKSDFLCKDRRSCVLKKLVCDGRAHCHDSSDEVDCSPVAPPPPPANRDPVLKCRLGSQLCQDGTQCVPYSHVCDGEKDCQDGSDEEECDTQMTTPPENGRGNRPPLPARTQPPVKPSCTSPSLLCPDSTCIPPTQICDGVRDCPDGSDEKTCLKRCKNKSDFLCKDRRSCVLKKQVCDGRAHCHDSSDEVDCSPVAPPPPPANRNSVLRCRLGSQLCLDQTQCVPYSHVCDGEEDCADGSDEAECESPTSSNPGLNESPSTAKPFYNPSCRSPTVLCPNSFLCISPTQMCDGRKDCPDGSDEDCVEKCPSKTDFLCKDGRSCVSSALVCDGRAHCHDGSDEVDCRRQVPRLTTAQVLKCRKGTRPCQDGKGCVLNSHVCDGEKDCLDGSDEEGCQNTCAKGEFQCAHGVMCIPEAQVCDGRAQCSDRSDELDCWEQTKSCEFRCADGHRCIPKKFLCDGEPDCVDGTDELGCDAQTTPTITSMFPSTAPVCITPSVRCPTSSLCVAPKQLCDGKPDCPDSFDESDCVFKCKSRREFLCNDRRKCIPRMYVCDGRAHCADGSDEKKCKSPDGGSPSSRDKAGPLKCRNGFQACRDGLGCVMYDHVCDGEKDCWDGSDEEGCAAECKADEFRCHHGHRCVRTDQVCDGQYDCQDRSDEISCESQLSGCHHRCDNATRCIPASFLCDGERDCADGSDEDKCGLKFCDVEQFRCTSGQCVSVALRCDGYADCSDHSDEADCSRPPRCPAELRCPHSHECLQSEWLCDGEEDCKDGSDEKNCETKPPPCRAYQWQCGSSSQCIPLSWRCDGKADCHNGVDEDKCKPRKCPSHLYRCGSGECVDPRLACNGLINCADSSDEGVGCKLRNCSSPSLPRCEHSCVSTPNGPICYCTAGFTLHSDAVSCVDTNECNLMPLEACKHTCLNTRGSYVCRCHPSFYLEPDNKSCKTKDEPLLVASVQSELLLLGVQSGSLRLLTSANQPVFSLDYHWAQQRVYWLSPDYQSIRWADMTKDSSSKGTLIKGVKSDFIAVDWVGKNLYWVDGLVGQIRAVRLSDTTLKSQDYTVVLAEDLELPRSLVLIPHKGLMMWSEIGSTPQIQRSGMDGSKKKVVVSSSLTWPVSLAYDFLDERIYWADEKLRCIGSASLDGDDVKILQLAETPSPFSVAVFNDRIFWSDTKRRTIRSADKNTGKDQKVLLKRPGQPFGLKLMHPLSQPAISNPCDQLRCSHMCLLTTGASEMQAAAVCRCPKGLILSKDKITCSLPLDSSFILLLSSTTVYQVYFKSLRQDGVGLKSMPNSRVLLIPGVVEATGLDLAFQALSLFVADGKKGTVDMLNLSGPRSRQALTLAGRLVQLKDDFVMALAVDWVTSNIYWSSISRPNIHVTSSREGYTTSLLQGRVKRTTSIAVHPPSSQLCYTAYVGSKSQAEVSCAWMDGRRKTVLWTKSSSPLSLVFSKNGTSIYWVDTVEGLICSIGLDGSGYKQYKAGPGLVTSITYIENMLLWITLEKEVTKMWFSDGHHPKQLWFETKSSLVEIRAYSRDSQTGSNKCAVNNGECEHICLPYPGGRVCKCARGFYSNGPTSCAPEHPCPKGEQACLDASKCINSSNFCDRRVDCPDQSDEQDCPQTSDQLPKPPVEPPRNSKDTSSCSQQHCSGHGSCVTQGEIISCQCTTGYRGTFCQEKESRRSHVGVILVVFCLLVVILAVSLLIAKRKGWLSIGGKSPDKETLMSNMVLESDYADDDCEVLESPADLKNPPVAS
ncbi:uncharacterized protein ACBT44_017953 isoform 4-T4 [Syngnathus typhle]